MLRARVAFAVQDGMKGGERWDLYGMEGKAGTPLGVMHVSAPGPLTHRGPQWRRMPRAPVPYPDILRKAATPVRMGEEGHPSQVMPLVTSIPLPSAIALKEAPRNLRAPPPSRTPLAPQGLRVGLTPCTTRGPRTSFTRRQKPNLLGAILVSAAAAAATRSTLGVVVPGHGPAV